MPQTALIVGIRGLGRVIATQFAAQGWRVIAAARSRATVDTVAAEIDAAGGSGVGVVCDLQSPNSLSALVQQHGPFDLVVAAQTSGARFGARPLLDIDDEEFDTVLGAYVRGSWNLLKAVGPQLIRQGRGTFLQIGTSSGVRTREGWAPLGCAQHGLRALIQIAAKEWRPLGVHVAYLPIDGGITRKPPTIPPAAPVDSTVLDAGPLPKSLAPEEIARACAFLHAQDRSAWTHELVLRPSGTDWTSPT